MRKSEESLSLPCSSEGFSYLCGKVIHTMWKEKLGNYLIDVSKYVLTGVVISSLFKDFGDSKILIYSMGIITSMLALVVGLILTNKTDKKKEGK